MRSGSAVISTADCWAPATPKMPHIACIYLREVRLVPGRSPQRRWSRCVVLASEQRYSVGDGGPAEGSIQRGERR